MRPYRLLFNPIQLGPAHIRNRVVFSAHLTNYAEGNLPGSRLTEYYRERARGGVGLIIIEEQSVHPSDFAYEKLIHAYDPDVVPCYRRLTTAVKTEGAAVFCQINHNGLQGFSFFNDEPLWGPSPVSDGLFREFPQSIGIDRIDAVVDGYRLVAVHAREGGFDGVELQASHSSILRQFLSPHTNHREDAYGGSLENRLRLMVRCLEAVREGGGAEMAVGIRLCTDELIDGGLTPDDVVEVSRRLDALGLVDFINTSIGTTARLYMVEGPMTVPSGYQSAHTAAIREAVRVPVIGVGRINDPLMADRLLQDGVADLVGVVRAQIADPDWAGKSNQDRAADIRKCIACNQYCIGLMGLNAPLSCIQNPANGEEVHWGNQSYPRTARPKRVWVIGAGPAGMEAAIVAAHYGHEVSLFDKEDRPGGTVNHIVKVPSRLEFGDLIRNKTSELKRYGVSMHLGREITLEEIEAGRPDAVVIATGQEEVIPAHIPGLQAGSLEARVGDETGQATEGNRVRTPLQVLSEPRPKPAHVLVVDEIGFHQASSLTEYLAECGCRISFVTSAFYPGQHLGVTLDLELWLGRMAALSEGTLRVYAGHILLDASGDPVLMDILANTQMVLEDVDWILPVNQGQPRDGLYHALKGIVPEVYRVGDALAPKDVGEAILDGHRAARRLSGQEVEWE